MIQTDLLPAFGVDVGAAREHLAGQRLNARRVQCHHGSRRCATGVLPVSRQVTGPALTYGRPRSGGHLRVRRPASGRPMLRARGRSWAGGGNPGVGPRAVVTTMAAARGPGLACAYATPAIRQGQRVASPGAGAREVCLARRHWRWGVPGDAGCAG